MVIPDGGGRLYAAHQGAAKSKSIQVTLPMFERMLL